MRSNESYESVSPNRFKIVMDELSPLFLQSELTDGRIFHSDCKEGLGGISLQTPYFDDDGAIAPEDLRLLHDVLVELCRGAQIETRSEEAAAMASHLVALFKSGFRSREELLYMGTGETVRK